MIVDTVSSKASLIYSAFKALDVSSHGEHFELVQLVCQPFCVCSLDSWVQTSVGFVFFKNRALAKRKLTNSSNSMYFFLGLNHLNPKIWLLTILLNCYIFPGKLIAWIWFLPLWICFSPHYRRRNFRHGDASSDVCTLIDNGQLTNQIGALLPNVVKKYIFSLWFLQNYFRLEQGGSEAGELFRCKRL